MNHLFYFVSSSFTNDDVLKSNIQMNQKVRGYIPGSFIIIQDPDKTQSIRSHQRMCTPGYYCVDGVRHLCPAGRYGSSHGESLSECSGISNPGYFAPPGSVSPTEYVCGKYIYFIIFCISFCIFLLLFFCWSFSLSLSFFHLCSLYFLTSKNVGLLFFVAVFMFSLSLCSLFSSLSLLSLFSSLLSLSLFALSLLSLSLSLSPGAPSYYCPAGSPTPIPVTIGYYTTLNGMIHRNTKTECDASKDWSWSWRKKWTGGPLAPNGTACKIYPHRALYFPLHNDGYECTGSTFLNFYFYLIFYLIWN